ncbi:hypothetical protein HK099_003525 [Clydaea vesicula]|uniref:Uncharacterized protein n=1 Tax=Clydaea vesicula TaxID=447962 RepID=A0AAD5UAY6_9FUNG|nr:hypothetical protein HK099_003525 [Clydaea vesicula]
MRLPLIESTKLFFKDLFLKQNLSKKDIFPHFTNCTDLKIMRKVIDSVRYMGLTEEEKIQKRISNSIDAEIKSEFKKLQLESSYKIMLLGSGESGKSTVLKQLKLNYTGGFSDKEKQHYKLIIFDNIFDSLKVLSTQMIEFGIQYESKENEEFGKLLQIGVPNEKRDSIKAIEVDKYWKDRGVQQCYLRANEFSMQETAEYFFNNINKIFSKTFTPEKEDILQVRHKTITITETVFTYKTKKFKVYDVGGQKSLRQFWVPYFSDDIKSVIFVASLSCYDQILSEEEDKEKTNAMTDSINLFKIICDNKLLQSILKVIKKSKNIYDILTKIQKGLPLLENSKEFFKNKFREVNTSTHRQIYTHFTNSTDIKIMKKVIDTVNEIIFRSSLEAGGMSLEEKEAKKISKSIDAVLEKERKRIANREEHKIIILGSGDSGKSTVIKQMKLNYANGFTKDEKLSYISHIWDNIFDSLNILTKNLQASSVVEDEELKNLCKIFEKKLSDEDRKSIKVEDISKFWSHPKIKECYDLSSKNILQVRVATSLIKEYRFTIKGSHFTFIDVGGQKSLRHAWIPYMEKDLQCLIFVSSLSCYDQTMVEEDFKTINRMEDSIQLFNKICSNAILKEIPIILFLNKLDIFEKKVKNSNSLVKKFFPEYTGLPLIETSKTFFKDKFLQQNSFKREIFVHYTNSTDTKIMKNIMDSVNECIVKFALRNQGMLL